VASARELLEQADALMRRNRSAVVDTEIPELTDMVAMVALAPAVSSGQVAAQVAVPAIPPPPATAGAPTILDDVPELTEAVEEIEIESIVELPEDLDESSGWLHYDHGELSVVGRGPDSIASSVATGARNGTTTVERARPPLAAVAKPVIAAVSAPSVAPITEAAPSKPVSAAEPIAPNAAPVAEPTSQNAAPIAAAPMPGGTADDWARWEALADEIRMQVLQRIDIFTETRLRDQLTEKLQPIVDRASAEMVSAINAHVGGILRAYIAEAIEREIEKWRGPPR